MAEFYNAEIEGRGSELSELSIQYADYSVWQREYLREDSEAFKKQMAYWKEQLQGVPTLLEMPTDYPRPAVQDISGGCEVFLIDEELTHRLRLLAEQEQVTLFMILLAALGVLLNRYTEQRELVIGSPIANRNREETEGLIGFFVNTLALRVDIEEELDFRTLLKQVKGTTLDAYQHQDLPFERLVESLGVERSLSYAPLFQVMLVLQNVQEAMLPIEGVSVSLRERDYYRISKFDLTFNFEESPLFLKGEIEYATALFKPATIKRLIEHFVVLLKEIVSNPVARLSELSVITEAERDKIVRAWNDTESPYPMDKTVHRLFEEQVERSGGEVAVIYEDKHLTYEELNAASNRLAHYLLEEGVKPETLVGICSERSLEMIVGILGILKAGGAYVPLDPTYPKERLDYMLSDAQTPVLLTQRHLVGELPETAARVVYLDELGEITRGYSEENPSSGVGPSNLAYVIYTSGSTGKPKGVMIEQLSLVNFLTGFSKSVNYKKDYMCFLSTTLSFDIAGLELYMPLIHGAKLVITDSESQKDPKLLSVLLERYGASILQLTPASWKILLSSGFRNKELIALCGGEFLSRDLAIKLSDSVSSVYNCYGPTEATIWSTQTLVDSKNESIGKPLPNTQCYILNSNFGLVPIGVVGELYIGGDGLARGYLNRPDLTAERFIANPFATREDEALGRNLRLYRTGDLCRYREDGNIEYIGRIDNQVKIRGFRIECGEIESRLLEHSDVKEAVVVAREDKGIDKRLVAYVSFKGTAVETSSLRSFVSEALPDYMVPSAFVVLEEFPLTPNGKLDRKALPAPEYVSEKSYVAPRDIVEFKLAQIWQKYLNISKISMSDNFFEVGGHSLLAISVIEAVNKEFCTNLPVASIFNSPTLDQFQRLLRKHSKSKINCMIPLKKEGSFTPLFCIHPVSGEVFCYVDLVKSLDARQPVYGLQQTKEKKVEAMAKEYTSAIKKIQREGPYSLLGWSMGGVIAHEIAFQLEKQGDEIAFLGLIDSFLPNEKSINADRELSRDRSFMIFAEDLWGRFGKVFEDQNFNNLSDEKCFEKLFYLARKENLIPPQSTAEEFKRLYDRCEINFNAMYAHKPKLIKSEIFSFIVRESKEIHEHSDAWTQYTKNRVINHFLEGDHYSVFKGPNLNNLASLIQKNLIRNLSKKEEE
ncbi:peptide synthetase, non-ribosomal [Legionella hackeliae]|nr:peptide synthetase, non-ribosomal [Legionella hackeliae]